MRTLLVFLAAVASTSCDPECILTECPTPTDTGTDTDTGVDTTTGDTGTTIAVGENLPIDLAVPSGDDEYDRYTALIMGLGDLADVTAPPSKQIDSGMSGLYGPSGQIGHVWVDAPLGPAHFVEHWFIKELPEAYTGQPDFDAEYIALKSWNKTRTSIQTFDPDWQTNTYLRMDIEYKQPVQELGGLCYNGPVVERWAFEVTQGGVVQANLLRELHHHPMLGDTFVDFWTFQANYDFLDVPGDTLESVNTGSAPAPPCDWYNAVGVTEFATVIYAVEAGGDFDF